MPKFIDDIKTAPERLAEGGSALRTAARKRVHTLRRDSEQRLFRLRVEALERAEGLAERSGIAPLERLVTRRLTAFTTPPIAEYDSLNVKQVTGALREAIYVDLLRVRRWEETHKNRKTVLSAVERELEKRERLPEAIPA